MKSKICRDCQKRKPLTEYHRGKAYRDGFYPCCKACSAIIRRQRYLKNRERVLEQWRAYYAARREEVCAKKKAWNKANQKYCQEYYRRNRDKMLEYGRKYREARKAREKLVHHTKMFTGYLSLNVAVLSRRHLADIDHIFEARQVNCGSYDRGFSLRSVISHKRMTKQRIDKDRRPYERRQSPKGQRRQFPPQR